tara:strand:- start:469 stop:672 length:204 start_codon:yes stop_codon:yes gene_type:complete
MSTPSVPQIECDCGYIFDSSLQPTEIAFFDQLCPDCGKSLRQMPKAVKRFKEAQQNAIDLEKARLKE